MKSWLEKLQAGKSTNGRMDGSWYCSWWFIDIENNTSSHLLLTLILPAPHTLQVATAIWPLFQENHLSTPSIAFQHHLPVSLILQIALKSMNNQTQLQLRGLICTWIRKGYDFSCQPNIMDIQSTTSSDLQHVKDHEILLLSQPDDSILFAQCLLGQGIHELIHSPTQGSRSRAPFCEC